jgi:hypothetical protein
MKILSVEWQFLAVAALGLAGKICQSNQASDDILVPLVSEE